MSIYLQATEPTPLFNTPHLEEIFQQPTQPLNEKGLFYPLEMVALRGTTFRQLEKMSPHIARVETSDYPEREVYIDLRTTETLADLLLRRKSTLPPKELVLQRLQTALGLPYLWGGNTFQPLGGLQKLYASPWILKGVDCSGLLYAATDGFTPRNTSGLLQFGEELSSLENVKPLDILVWPGHVILVLDSDTVIESLHGQGVITTPLTRRLSQIQEHPFVIRRFY